MGAVYTTSDGGFEAKDFYAMVALLDDHVEIVNFETLTQMALSAHKAGLGDQVDYDQIRDFGKVSII